MAHNSHSTLTQVVFLTGIWIFCEPVPGHRLLVVQPDLCKVLVVVRRSLLQVKKQEERIIRLEADVKKYKSESAKLKKQIKQETEQYEILLSEKDSTIDEYLKISDCKYFY